VQVLVTLVLGLIVPFFVYDWLAEVGLDISWVVYIAVVIGLVTTAALIWTEGLYATTHNGTPEVAGSPEPPATAIICAYLPNEAARIVETIEHFLTIDYPAGLQVILAYNTPRDLPVEIELKEIARRHPNLLLLRVVHSKSKAQNLNAGLTRATGDFVGIFDADTTPNSTPFIAPGGGCRMVFPRCKVTAWSATGRTRSWPGWLRWSSRASIPSAIPDGTSAINSGSSAVPTAIGEPRRSI